MNAQDAFEYFDRCDAVDIEFMLGRWKGSGFPAQHPLDGLLETYGWYGKEFISADIVHPLLFKRGTKAPYQLTSQGLPLKTILKYPIALPPLFIPILTPVKWILNQKKPTARLREMNYRGKVSVGMVYDYQPIIDHFRKIDPETMLGVMDCKYLEGPFFFQLHREASNVPTNID